MGYTHGIIWTKEMVHEEALKYTRRVDFQKNSAAAENAARKNGWLDEVCSHMVRLKTVGRTKEECHEVALKYQIVKDFKDNDGAVHLYANRRGWLHDITSHMKKNINWDDRKDEVHQVALKYQNRGEFCLKDEKYYEVARRRGWLDDVCGHMISVGHKFKRLVYVYKFEDNTVYVGLTGNDIKRSHSHSTSNDSPVYRYSQEMGLNPTKEIITDGYIDSEVAKNIEHETIELYRGLGWNVLNKVKAGGLGGCDRIWTEEKIMETISKYTHESEFRKNEHRLVNKLQSTGKINEYMKLLIKDTPIFWNEELVIETISKYTHLKDFVTNHPGARGWIRKKKKEHLLDGLINFNIDRCVIKKWDNKEEILETASKYQTISQFQTEHGGMYRSAEKQGWLDDVKGVIPPKFLWTKDKAMEITQKYVDYQKFRKENKGAYEAIMKYRWLDCLEHLNRGVIYWTVETAKQEALKYNGRNDFLLGSAGAYGYLKNNGLLDEATSHMELKNVKGTVREVFICSVCGEKVGAKGNLIRWHEDNCKDRPNSNKNKR
jgi:hypothetical protein